MNKYNEGDRVRAEMDSTVIEGSLWGCEELFVGSSRRTLYALLTDCWTITVIEKALPKVVLPTEPGFYITAYNDPDVFELYLSGDWFLGDQAISEARVIHDGGNQLTRLEPVPETAKKVLEYLEDSAVIDVRDPRCAGVRARFGVEL